MNAVVRKFRDMASDKALDIGSAWNALDEAADAIESAEWLCRLYFEIASECIGEDEVRKRRDSRIASRVEPLCARCRLANCRSCRSPRVH